jgi:cellulose synthase/poly-beta-1,6-N-acetylglucosamine synthase-like glycosyltransferase
VIDNASIDKTIAVVERLAQKHQEMRIRVIRMAQNNLGAARAAAAQAATYPALAFLDADCLAPPQWIEKSYQALIESSEDPLVMGLGSGNAPPSGKNRFNDALRIQLSSFLGNLNSPQAKVWRQRKRIGHLPTCNVFYFKNRLLAAGNFSSRFERVCEDLEFSLRAGELGYHFIYLPGTEMIHEQPDSIRAWAAKMFRYGWGQIDVARLHPRHLLGLRAIPLLLAPSLLALLVFMPAAFWAAALAYLSSIWIYSFSLGLKNGRPVLVLKIFLLFVVTHFFYGLGELWGLVRQIKNRKMK